MAASAGRARSAAEAKGARLASLLLLAASAALLAGAYGFQYLGGLPPCEMCWWQRYAHMAVVAIALVAAIVGKRWAAWLAVLAMVIAALLGLYHAGVELKWWEGVTACTAPVGSGLSTAAMMEALMNAPLVRCDAIPWSLFGISMAGWNAICSAIAATAATVVLRLSRPKA